MSVTLEQVREAVQTNPDLKNGIISSFKDDFLQAPPEGVVIRTAQQDQEFLNNHITTLLPSKVEEQFNKRFKESLDQLDSEVEQLTGIPKNVPANGHSAKEKTTDYIKRAFVTLKEKGSDPVTTAKVRELEAMLQSKDQEYSEKLTQAESALFQEKINFQVDSELGKVNIALPGHLKTDTEKQAYVQQQKAMLKGGFLSQYTPKKDEQGTIVYYKGDTPQMSQKDGKPKTAGEIMQEEFSAWFVPETRTVTGTGTGQQGITTAGKFTDKASVHAHLAASGLDVDSETYMQQFKKLCAENGIVI